MIDLKKRDEYRVRVSRHPSAPPIRMMVQTVRLETARLAVELALAEVEDLSRRAVLRARVIELLDKDASR